MTISSDLAAITAPSAVTGNVCLVAGRAYAVASAPQGER